MNKLQLGKKKGKNEKNGFLIAYVTLKNQSNIMPPIKYCKYNFGKTVKITVTIIIIKKPKETTPLLIYLLLSSLTNKSTPRAFPSTPRI